MRMTSSFSISKRVQAELDKRGFSSALGHVALAAVIYIFTDVEVDHPLATHAFMGVIISVNILRLVFGYLKTPVYLLQLSLIALAWGGLCGFTIREYGLHHEFTLILLLVTCGIAAAAVTSLVPSLVMAVGFLTLLFSGPFMAMLENDFGKPVALILVTYYLFLLLQIRTQSKQYQEREKIEETLYKALNIKSEFLANVSHEIRTPINGILGMASLLRKENLSKNGKDFLNIMTTCGDTLLTLINDILDFSKMEAGKLNLENFDFNVNMLLRDVITLFGARAKDKNIILKLKLEIPDDFWAQADATRLRQVLNNLVGNAIKFTSRGEIVVSASIKDDNGKFEITVNVKDSGIGIPIDVKDKLFQSFTQVDASTTRKYGGTGLGLVICKGICEAMGGTIWFESELNVGSTFSFKILVNKGNPQNVKEVNGFEFDKELAKKKPLTILVADDNSTNQILAKQYLEMLGYAVEAVGNGLEVLDALTTKTYDVIFMDGMMPEMDGYLATENLRKRLASEKQPWVIALTASATEKDQQRCRDAGMDDFVPKPFTVNSLADAILRVRANKTATLEKKTETTTTTTTKVVQLNREFLLQHFAGDDEIMLKFINGYLRAVPKQLGNLQSAVDNKDLKQLHMSAHSLRGSVANFFAVSIMKALDEIEHINDIHIAWDEMQISVEKIWNEINDLNAQLADFVKSREAA